MSGRTALLLAIGLGFAAFLHIAERAIAGIVQCDAAQTCPRSGE